MTPERLQERLERWPELAMLVADASVAEDAEGFFARADAFAALLGSPGLHELVRRELTALVADPARNVQDSFEGVWVIAAGEAFELTLVTAPEVDDGRPAILHGSPRHRLVGAFWPEAIEVELFRHPRPHPSDVFDVSLVLEPFGARTLRRGEVLRQRAWFDVVELAPASAPAYALVFASAPVDRLRWTYERASLRPHRPTPASLAASHLEYAIGTLVHLEPPDAAEAIAGLATHPAHHVRWSAIRAVSGLDRERGLVLLRGALADPHPHVRNAARRGLAGLDEGEA
ncbi:HEAT repeat domain-containing protein [Nannocystis punicea]|uniref:HEAT repeat domain-containing protein n=1 Tax=Nannocystis punicea TaxID=2995304 RepID=A0ABY7H779_9BACT|nr:HEAT repeat domain-containing protein [Nannocystis poenicansa]WAS95128.1 HEAT repeat domain-containing protein [Nannocystis poenicansa]